MPGDQFCGSCGAFLEWEGQPVTPEAAEAIPDAGLAALVARGSAPTTAPSATPATPATPAVAAVPATPATPASPATPATPAADAQAGLVRCPACGIANPATRTFCLSCGATLARAARVAAPTAAVIAAAVTKTAPRAATTPVPGAAPRAAMGAAAPPSRGFPTWILAVGALGIVVGVAVVAASMLLGGKGPGSIATSAPGSAAMASGSASASAGAAGTASAVPSAAPSASAATVAIALKSAKASSVLIAKFAAAKAIDGDPATCWQEGKPVEKGQWIEVTFGKARVDSITLYNGYELSNDAYYSNLRLRDVTVSVNGGKAIPVQLKDALGPQRFDLGGIAGGTKIRVTIVSTYASKKTSWPGSPFDDAALSEIVVEGVPG